MPTTSHHEGFLLLPMFRDAQRSQRLKVPEAGVRWGRGWGWEAVDKEGPRN